MQIKIMQMIRLDNRETKNRCQCRYVIRLSFIITMAHHFALL